MPKPSLHTLTWSEAHQHYELQSHSYPEQWFRPGDEPAFSRWLEEHTSFAFVGRVGRLSAVKEARQRGTGYWYAYRKQDRHTRKCYLGSSNQVTFARLEEQARRLTSLPPSPPLAPKPSAPSSEQKGVLLLALLSALPDDGPGAAAMPFLGGAISHSYISRLLATFEPEEEKHVLRAGAHLARQQHTQPEPPQAEGQHVEPLSRQEQRVLRLLVSGLTYAEMAEALIVSPNTVKTQVSSIYRKLGVGRRAEAIAVTARLRLLSPNL